MYRREDRFQKASSPSLLTRKHYFALLFVIGEWIGIAYTLFNENASITFTSSTLNLTALTYYSLAILAVTPIMPLYAMYSSPLAKTGWDLAFFIGAASRYMYFYVLLQFAAAVVYSFTGALPTLNPLTSGISPLLQLVFWFVLFIMPATFMKGTIIAAANAPKHGFQERSSLWDILGFAANSAAAFYILLKMLPAADTNILSTAITINTITLFILSLAASYVFGAQYNNRAAWMVGTGITIAVIGSMSVIFGL